MAEEHTEEKQNNGGYLGDSLEPIQSNERKQEEAARRREGELDDEKKKLGEERDLKKTQHETEFKEYQDNQELENEKLKEYNIWKEREQNQLEYDKKLEDKDLIEMVEEIRVVMFGKTGVGKSLLGNKILGQDTFAAAVCAQSVTKNITRGERMIDNNCKIVLVDTPGLFDTETNDNMETAKILARTVTETIPGPHVFIFVLSIGNRFTAEEQATVEFLKDLFGSHVTDYLIIVFTGKDNLDYDKIDLESYIKHAGKDLKSIVSQCQGTMAINNRASDEEVTKSVDSLIQMIKGVYLKNETKHYTDELLAEAQRIFEEKLRKQEEEAHKKERELEDKIGLLTKEYETKCNEHKSKYAKVQEELRNGNIDKNRIAELKRQKAKLKDRKKEMEEDYKEQLSERKEEMKENKKEFKKFIKEMNTRMEKSRTEALEFYNETLEEHPKCSLL